MLYLPYCRQPRGSHRYSVAAYRPPPVLSNKMFVFYVTTDAFGSSFVNMNGISCGMGQVRASVNGHSGASLGHRSQTHTAPTTEKYVYSCRLPESVRNVWTVLCDETSAAERTRYLFLEFGTLALFFLLLASLSFFITLLFPLRLCHLVEI